MYEQLQGQAAKTFDLREYVVKLKSSLWEQSYFGKATQSIKK